MRKILIVFVIIFVLLGAWGLYSALKYDEAQQTRKISLKAPQASVTLLDGWTNKDIANYLQKNGVASSTDFSAALDSFDASSYSLLAANPKNSTLEGFIFPDTYFIPASSSSGTVVSNIIITKALNNFSEKVTPQMQAQAGVNGLSLYQTIVLASIIEKESGANMDDKKTIAGVFYNRLKAGMPLQSDATVSYITGNAEISTADTQIDSPYNTYKYKGLPVGPICNPGLSSIMAALYPEPSDYFYFLTDPATGRAVFAQTNDQQVANKQKYLK